MFAAASDPLEEGLERCEALEGVDARAIQAGEPTDSHDAVDAQLTLAGLPFGGPTEVTVRLYGPFEIGGVTCAGSHQLVRQTRPGNGTFRSLSFSVPEAGWYAWRASVPDGDLWVGSESVCGALQTVTQVSSGAMSVSPLEVFAKREADKRAIPADDAMTRHHDREGIPAVGRADGAGAPGHAQRSGQRAVGGGGAVGDGGDRRPHPRGGCRPSEAQQQSRPSTPRRAARLRGDARVFSVGMGADVNVGLIEQLALEGRGTAHFVRPEESVERAVELLATRLRQPLLTDVRVSVDGNVRLSRLYPSGPQDIFAGQDLVLLARYDGSGTANVTVTGNAAGRRVRWSSQRSFPREARDNAFVPRLWATQRIGWLSAEKRRNGGSSEIDDEIRQLGERFGIPTEFTSYLVLEPGMVANQSTRRLRPERSAAGVGGGSGMTGNIASAPPPAAPARAFEAARQASDQRAAKSVAAADSVAIQLTALSTRLARR